MYLSFLINLIYNNKVKFLWIFLSIFILSICSKTPSNSYNEYKVLSTFEYSDKFYYTLKPVPGNDPYVKGFDKPIKIVNNSIIIKEIRSIKVILIALFIVLCIILLFSSMVEDEDMNWEISSIWNKLCLTYVECDMENDIYYYHYKGRLLYKAEYKVDNYHLINSIIRFNETPNLYPIFEGTKTKKRDNKLSEILS